MNQARKTEPQKTSTPAFDFLRFCEIKPAGWLYAQTIRDLDWMVDIEKAA